MEFTNTEQERINQLYGNDFTDIKPEDAELIARWEAWKASQELEYKAKTDALKAETNAKMEESKRIADKAIADLEYLKNAALARLERLG